MPIICKLIYSGKKRKYKVGPWNLGKFSIPINCWAVIWTLFISIIFLMPTNRPVTPENMNYAVIFLVGILLFAMSYWFIGGARKSYIGPCNKNDGQKQNNDNQFAFPSDANVSVITF